MKQLFLLSIFFPIILYGKDTTSINGKRFFIGINFSPNYCYRYLTKNDNNLTDDKWTTIKNLEDSIYIPKFGYTTGINFGFQINRKFSVETGIQYSNNGYKTIPFSTLYHFNEPTAIATNIINYKYMDIPFIANFSFFSDKRVQIIIGVGSTLNYLLQVSGKTIPETPTATFQTKTNVIKYPYNKINISTTISAGFKYKINDRINLRAAPIFRYGLLNIDNKSYSSIHLWNAGLNISFNIGL